MKAISLLVRVYAPTLVRYGFSYTMGMTGCGMTSFAARIEGCSVVTGAICGAIGGSMTGS